VYQLGINKGIILRCTAYQISTSVSLHIRELHQLHRLNGVTCGWL